MTEETYTAPVKVGDKIEIEIINIGEKGDGIGKHEGFVIIVPKGKLLKTHKVRVKKVFEKFAIADITR